MCVCIYIYVYNIYVCIYICVYIYKKLNPFAVHLKLTLLINYTAI